MSDLPDPDNVVDILRDVGETIILPYFRRLEPGDVRQKSGPLDLVTVADEAAERALSARLTAIAPGSIVVGEEEVSKDPTILARLGGDAPVWIIDPIDGTYNFASGNPEFGILLAYARGGQTLAGWIHDPCGDRTAVGVRGRGVVIGGWSPKLAVPETVAEARGVVSRRYCDEEVRLSLEERAALLGEGRPSVCSAHEYLRILTGDAHFSFYNQVRPWDHAAGSLLLMEAGGWSAFIDGRPYGPTEPEAPLLVASSRATWNLVRSHLFG